MSEVVTSTPAEPNFEKLKSKLRELFELDKADLDFGIYRILRQRHAEITEFLDKHLEKTVREALTSHGALQNEQVKQDLETAEENARRLGIAPEQSPLVLELRAKYKAGADLDATASEIYSHLFTFFSRYYQEGDFLGLSRATVQGREKYMIPYNGEEVKLVWVTMDQYYIKSSEMLRDYTFHIRRADLNIMQPTLLVASDDEPEEVAIHFKLIEGDTEKDNRKPNGQTTRVFTLDADQPFAESDDATLTIQFRYLEQASEKNLQRKLNELTEKTLADTLPLKWKDVLFAIDPIYKGKDTRSLLQKHLRNYTARHQFDYFIHKNLGGFLRRELDFYIKNEVMHLDDIENLTAPKAEQYLSKIRALRHCALPVIRMLAQLEDFQKKLWLKKKFVVETCYCLTIDRVPEELYEEICANDAQWAEWEQLYAISEIEQNLLTAKPRTSAFLSQHPHMMLDTRHYNREFTLQLLTSIDNLDETLDGICFHSENFQALQLMQERYEEQLKVIYIDPPYNTEGDGFIYKDNFQHSSWEALMFCRLVKSRLLLEQGGILFSSIGREECARLQLTGDTIFGEMNRIADLIWEKGRKNDAKFFSLGHDYILAWARLKQHMLDTKTIWREEKPGAREILVEYRRLKDLYEDDYLLIQEGIRSFYQQLTKDHPALKHRRYNRVDRNGIWRDDNISWPGGNGPRYDVIHPKTGRPCKVPDGGWRFATREKFRLYEDNGFIEYRDDTDPPILKRYLNYVSMDFDPDARRHAVSGNEDENSEDVNVQVMPSVFYKNQQPTVIELRHLMGRDCFKNPKDPDILARLFRYTGNSLSIILDYFAGSGTTGHAVIKLNREDAGSRKYILVEMGDHLDTVIAPRLKKVVYSTDWHNGKPQNRDTGISHAFKIVRLESYEDTLNNLRLQRTPEQIAVLQRADDHQRAEYLLGYFLDVESEGSASLLDTSQFRDPFSYQMQIATSSAGETKATRIDLVETFNWLLGLKVKHINAQRDFLTVTGEQRTGGRTLIIWRTLSDDQEADNTALEKYLSQLEFNPVDTKFDFIYVNGSHTLPDPHKKIHLIEEVFQRRMFESNTFESLR